MLGRLRHALVHLELCWLEDLVLSEAGQLIFLLLLPVEYLKPVLLLDRDTFSMEVFASHAYLHIGLCQLSILTDRSQKMSGQQIVDPPLIVR